MNLNVNNDDKRWYKMDNITKRLTKLVKSRKNQKIIYKISRINQSSRFIDNNKSDKNE